MKILSESVSNMMTKSGFRIYHSRIHHHQPQERNSSSSCFLTTIDLIRSHEIWSLQHFFESLTILRRFGLYYRQSSTLEICSNQTYSIFLNLVVFCSFRVNFRLFRDSNECILTRVSDISIQQNCGTAGLAFWLITKWGSEIRRAFRFHVRDCRTHMIQLSAFQVL